MKRRNISTELYNKSIIDKRSQHKDFYVLHYNMVTTEYLNDIVFMTYDEAKALYEQSKSISVEDRVELIFAPADNDVEFSDNIVLESKFTMKQQQEGE